MSDTDLPVLDHWIDGAASAGSSDRLGDVFDPARGVVQKHVRLASAGDVDNAVAVARKAFSSWGQASIAKRQSVMFAFRELLNSRQGELAAILTSEHGKVLSDAGGEIARGLEVVEFACSLPHLIKGSMSENVSTDVDVFSLKQPLGVVGVISPFNFPAMVPMWFFPIAIATGNCVILKPSEKDPSAANWMAELMAEAGLPPGVFNVVHGDKEAVDAILTHPDIASISFVGSTPIARYVYETGTAHGKRVQALGGAKNHMLVLPDADLDLVADSAVNAGFGSAGERCMAVSVVLAVDSVADPLIEKITSRMATLKIGDGTRGTDMGPLITREHRDKVASYVDIAATDGAERRRRRSRPGRRRRRRGLLDGPDAARQGADDVGRLPARDLRPGALDRPRLRLRGGDRADQLRALRQRQRDLHQRRRSGPPLPARGRGRHGRDQRADPGAGRLPLLRRLEGTRSSATRRPTAPTASTSSPARRRSPSAGSTRRTVA